MTSTSAGSLRDSISSSAKQQCQSSTSTLKNLSSGTTSAFNWTVNFDPNVGIISTIVNTNASFAFVLSDYFRPPFSFSIDCTGAPVLLVNSFIVVWQSLAGNFSVSQPYTLRLASFDRIQVVDSGLKLANDIPIPFNRWIGPSTLNFSSQCLVSQNQMFSVCLNNTGVATITNLTSTAAQINDYSNGGTAPFSWNLTSTGSLVLTDSRNNQTWQSNPSSPQYPGLCFITMENTGVVRLGSYSGSNVVAFSFPSGSCNSFVF